MHLKCHAELTNKPKPFNHQLITAKLLRREPSVFDMSDPGTGKTRPAIEAWVERYRRGGGKALVLAVKSNLESVWQEETNLWAPDAEVSVAYAHNRIEAFDRGADIYVTNTDAAKWVAANNKNFFKQFDTLLVDESSYFKHRTSDRSKALAKIAPRFEFKENLSGTPTSNGILDIWHQMFVLDEGKRLGSNFYRFREAVCSPYQVGPDRKKHIEWVDKEDAEEAVISLISRICVRHDIDECTDIPKNFVHRHRYNLPPRLKAQYIKLAEEALLQLKQGKVYGTNKAVLRNKLFQLCSGAVYTSAGKYEVLDPERYKVVANLVEERGHSLIFFVWTHQRDLIVKELKKRKIPHAYLDGSISSDRVRNRIVTNYEKGKYRTLLIHPKTGAHGFNQFIRAKSEIWASPIYEPDLLKQGIHRIRRAGQTSKTETIIITANGTVEDIVYANRENKQKRMNKFFEIVRQAHELS